MKAVPQPVVWRAFGSSVCGASHQRRRLPNQDALRWQPNSAGGATLAVAVADGHGSPMCFRSAAGADLAVNAATELLVDAPGFDEAAEWLPRRLTEEWRRAVEEHVRSHPFSAQELDGLARQRPVQDDAARALLAYGSTILTAIATPECMVYAQLGDGDILLVSETGEVARPFPADRRLLGMETTSLCGEEAWNEMRVLVQPASEPLPELVLLATDGYANSFRDDRGFLKIGADVLEMIRQDGIEGVAHNLEGWLSEASELGSGDDITLGGLCRTPEGSVAHGA